MASIMIKIRSMKGSTMLGSKKAMENSPMLFISISATSKTISMTEQDSWSLARTSMLAISGKA